jgi:hypothetical protein
MHERQRVPPGGGQSYEERLGTTSGISASS